MINAGESTYLSYNYDVVTGDVRAVGDANPDIIYKSSYCLYISGVQVPFTRNVSQLHCKLSQVLSLQVLQSENTKRHSTCISSNSQQNRTENNNVTKNTVSSCSLPKECLFLS